MTRKSIGLSVRGTRNSKPGGNLVAIEEGVVAEVVAPNPVSPGHKVTSITNDKYHLYPTGSQVGKKLVSEKDSNCKFKHARQCSSESSQESKPQPQSLANIDSQDVYCLAVNHVHSANFLGHPQKKGLSPVVSKK